LLWFSLGPPAERSYSGQELVNPKWLLTMELYSTLGLLSRQGGRYGTNAYQSNDYGLRFVHPAYLTTSSSCTGESGARTGECATLKSYAGGIPRSTRHAPCANGLFIPKAGIRDRLAAAPDRRRRGGLRIVSRQARRTRRSKKKGHFKSTVECWARVEVHPFSKCAQASLRTIAATSRPRSRHLLSQAFAIFIACMASSRVL
jgi:hypothetical protein